MCRNIAQYSSAFRYAELFGVSKVCATQPHYNLTPKQQILAIRADGAEGRELVSMRWGFTAAWLSVDRPVYNARWETVWQKPMFADSFASHRCIVPIDGFYEWRSGMPYFIQLHSGEPMGAAGLWEGKEDAACVIITVPSQKDLQEVHDRMPLILEAEGYADWLNPQISSPSVRRLEAELSVRNVLKHEVHA